MRDPVRPIPSPAAALRGDPRARRFWQGEPDLAPLQRAGQFDPIDLLPGPARDLRGLDRRTRARADGLDGRPSTTEAPSVDGARQLVAATHEPLDAVLGLVCRGPDRGHWSLVRTISLSPQGVLVRLLDLMDPRAEPHDIARGREVMARLIPILGRPGSRRSDRNGPSRGASPLATVGSCVLAPRMVAALSQGANRPSAGGPAPAVELIAPCGPPSGPFARRRTVARIPGELSALTDPNPRVLGLALRPSARTQLLFALGHEGAGRRRTR